MRAIEPRRIVGTTSPLTVKPGRLLVFAHVQKAAGTTLASLLRQHFGTRHLDAMPVRGWLYHERQLKADLSLPPYRNVVSISGHYCRPFIDYGCYADRMVWYTMLRDPVARYISHYQHHIEKIRLSLSFEEFLALPIQRNWQVQFLAGAQDLDRAKQLLTERFAFVGLSERFLESMLLMRRRLDLPELAVEGMRRRNAEKFGLIKKSIVAEFPKWEEQIRRNNALDLALYDYVETVLYPRQVQDYGADVLAKDVARCREGEPTHWADRLREREADLTRRYLYHPLLRLRRRSPRWSWITDERR